MAMMAMVVAGGGDCGDDLGNISDTGGGRSVVAAVEREKDY